MKIDVEKFLKELEILVNMDSGQGNTDGITAVAKFFTERMEKKGWIASLVDVGDKTGKCAVIKNREADRYDVMLVGHIDTVFPKGEASKMPFRQDGKRAYGLGVIDMKQGALQMLYIMEQLPEAVFEKLNIVAIFNPDEEINSIYSAPVIERYAKISDYAYIFEAASTDGSHTIQRKGFFRCRAEFFGRAGHAGYIHDGNSISAVNELIYWSYELNKLCRKETGTTVNVGKIEGGKKYNIVPDYACMEFELRYDTQEEYEGLLKLLEALEIHGKEAGVKIRLSDKLTRPPLVPDEKTLAYEKRIKKISEDNGIPYKSKSRGGVSDANIIAVHGPVCIDGLAPTGDFDHSPEEYLEISTIEPNIRFSYLILCDLADMKE